MWLKWGHWVNDPDLTGCSRKVATLQVKNVNTLPEKGFSRIVLATGALLHVPVFVLFLHNLFMSGSYEPKKLFKWWKRWTQITTILILCWRKWCHFWLYYDTIVSWLITQAPTVHSDNHTVPISFSCHVWFLPHQTVQIHVRQNYFSPHLVHLHASLVFLVRKVQHKVQMIAWCSLFPCAFY